MILPGQKIPSRQLVLVSKGTLGILAPLSSPAHSCCCLPGRVALQQPLLFHWQIGSLERNQEGLLSPAIHTATPKP